MTESETNRVKEEVREALNKITEYSQEARLDSFLNAYHNCPDFLHFSADGKMRTYSEFRQICTEYYTSLIRQKLFTISRTFQVLDANLVITGWTGNINAQFKNGQSMNMSNYSVTHVFKKIGSDWKIIHSHESSLPPEIIGRG
ncbi:MAG TPA: nuclear transport factor 2 family protein [Chitinophagaceae bacterium]|nr:nuclear transport factor 2 family protein [Chitinophagaceae bacterium]